MSEDNFAMPPFNPYWVLGVNDRASMGEIHFNHHFLTRWFYPDKSDKHFRFGKKCNIVGPANKERFNEVQEAFRILYDVDLKAKYDKMAHEISLQLGDEREEVHDSNGFCKCCICRSWQNKKKSLQSHESNPWNYGETMKTVDRVNFAMIDVMAAYGKLNKEVAELTHLSEMTVRALNSAAYDIDFLSLKLRLCEEDFIAIGNKKWGKFKHHIDGTTVDNRIHFLIYLMHRVEFLDLKLSDLTLTFEELKQENPGTEEAKKLEKRFRNLALQTYRPADYTLKEKKLERDSLEREKKMESILLSSA